MAESAKKRKIEENKQEEDEKARAKLNELILESSNAWGLPPKDPIDEKIFQHDVLKLKFKEACDELARFLEARIRNYRDRCNAPKFKTAAGHLKLHPGHFVNELQRLRQLVERRKDVFEKHRDLLREGYETHGSFQDYMKKN